METNEHHPKASYVLQMRTRNPIYSELAVLRQLAIVTCISAEIQKLAEEWESCNSTGKGRASGGPRPGAVSTRKLRAG